MNGLDANEVISVKSGDYDYFVDVFGFGKFTGTVSTGNTVTIDLSATDFITVSGNINDDEGTDLAGALVTFKNVDDNTVETRSYR